MSRVFPVFFGKREDVSGQIGNLFEEEVFANLPDVVPVASINLAITLLRANGVEPRPEVTTITIKGVINQMKRFLCVFAWNIESPDWVTSESTNQMLQILKSSLDSKTPSFSAQPANECAQRCTLSLQDCVDTLKKFFGIDSSAAPEVIKKSLEYLGDDVVTSKCNEMRPLVFKARYLVDEVAGLNVT